MEFDGTIRYSNGNTITLTEPSEIRVVKTHLHNLVIARYPDGSVNAWLLDYITYYVVADMAINEREARKLETLFRPERISSYC